MWNMQIIRMTVSCLTTMSCVNVIHTNLLYFSAPDLDTPCVSFESRELADNFFGIDSAIQSLTTTVKTPITCDSLQHTFSTTRYSGCCTVLQ